MNKTIIAAIGVKGSGKTTSCNLIKEMFPEFQQFALASKIKKTLSEISGLKIEYFEEQNLKEKELITPIELGSNDIFKIASDFKLDVGDKEYEFLTSFIGLKLKTPRKAMQIVATEILRNFNEDIHCEFLKKELSKNSIITDMRFISEFNYFNNLDNVTFIPFYISNFNAEIEALRDGHRSELEVFKIKDRCISIDNNCKNLEKLQNQIKNKILV